MLQVHDIRETRVYKEAEAEGDEKRLRLVIRQLAANNIPVERIASILEVGLEKVREVIAKNEEN